jgi:hypothetical protein
MSDYFDRISEKISVCSFNKRQSFTKRFKLTRNLPLKMKT